MRSGRDEHGGQSESQEEPEVLLLEDGERQRLVDLEGPADPGQGERGQQGALDPARAAP